MVLLLWGIALIAAATALVLHRRGRGSLILSCFAAWSSGALAAGALLLMAWWFVLHEAVAEFPANLACVQTSPIRWENRGPLRLGLGDLFPDIDAEGWTNGLWPGDSFAGNIVVVNIFDDH